MSNFLSNLGSFARLFSVGGLGQPNPHEGYGTPPFVPYQQQVQQQQQEPLFDIDAEIAKIYQPRTEMQDMTRKMLQQFPERDPNPSKWRRIGAVIAGMGSENPIAASDQFMNYHYNNQLRDFKTKFDPVSKAADDERLANAQLRGLAEQTVSRKLTDLERQRKEKADAVTAKSKEAQIKINEDKQRLAWVKQSQPQLKLVNSIKGGNVYAFNPLTGDLKDTGIDSGTLTDAEKIALQLESSLEQIHTRADEARKTQTEGIGQRNEATKEQINLRDTKTKENIDLREQGIRNRPPRTTGTGTSAALNEQRERYNRAQEAALKPEWSKWITLDPGNRFSVKAPKSGYFGSGPDAATHKAITDFITGKKTTSGLPNNNTTAKPTTSGKVRVQSPDGKTGTIDASELSAALAAGWKKIGG